MAKLEQQLELDSCPHCGRANPTLQKATEFIETNNNLHNCPRWWGVYKCNSCGGLIVAYARKVNSDPKSISVEATYPQIPGIDDNIPNKALKLLKQAQNSFHAPAGLIMLCASAVDAMLKEKDYVDGSLYERIDKATKGRLITDEMAKWAHQIRLDANDQRHADKDAELPTKDDAKLVFDFAMAFAQYLFVLPAKVSRGISDSEPKTQNIENS